MSTQLRQLASRVNLLAGEVRRLSALIEGRGSPAIDQIAQRRLGLREDVRTDLAECAECFVAVYPGITLDILTSRLRTAWAEEARTMFIGLVARQRPHVSGVELGLLMLKHPTTIGKALERFNNSMDINRYVVRYSAVEEKWLAKMHQRSRAKRS